MDLANIRALLPEFKTTFLDTPKGLDHMAWFPAGRAIGRKNLAEAARRADAGEDVTDFVLSKLLPHLDSSFNRERGAWCCIAPVVTREIRQWFEGAAWAKHEDWPQIARLVLAFVVNVISDPERLAAECEAFRESPYSKGFQSGFLSPILNAVRPEDFTLVNSKTKRALKSLAGVRCRSGLIHYPESNAVVRTVVDDLGPDLLSAGLADVLPGDVFDAFCHWWVSLYKGEGGIAAEDLEDSHGVDAAEAMGRFFGDETGRRRICELMATHIEMAHALSPSCWVVTVRSRRIRLNVGRLAALEFTKEHLRLGLVPDDLPDGLRDDFQKQERWSTEFATQPVTRLCAFTPEQYWKLERELAESVKEFVRIAAQTGAQTPFHRFHSSEMPEYLERLLGRVLPRPVYQAASVPKVNVPPGQTVAMETAIRFDARQSLFHKVDYTVGHLVSSIELGDIGLPELQRPFVWDRLRDPRI